MKISRINKHLSVLVLVLVVIIQTNIASLACGPFFPSAYFSYSNHPDLPLNIFAKGNLGILQPSLAESYLVIAYRYLTNNPLSSEAQEAVVNLWHYRLSFPVDANEKIIAPWLSLRNTVPGTKKLTSWDISTQRQLFGSPAPSIQYPACGEDAFIHAAQTLKVLITKYGITSKTVTFWVANQDKVFQNCNWVEKDTVILPDKPINNLDAFTNSLYIYQIASAYFYAGHFTEALKYFDQLAADNNCPFNKLAKYLTIRTKVQAMVLPDKTATDNKASQQIERDLSAALNDSSLSEYKSDIQKLIRSIDYTFHAEKCFHTLALNLMKDNTRVLYEDLDDYTTLLCKLTNQDNTPSKSLALTIREQCKDDLTDWLLSFCDLKQNKNHIQKKWHENKTTPWLIAALAASTKPDIDTNALIESVDKLAVNSPGYLTAQYYLVTLLARSDNKNDRAIAKTKIDQILQHPPNDMTPSARNIFLAERQKLASTLDEYIHYALKKPVAEIADPSYKTLPDDYDQIEKGNTFPNKLPATFDDRMASTLNNQLPFHLWQKLADNKELPPPIKAEVISATWLRAILLNKINVAKSLVPAFIASYPSLKSMLQSYKMANNPVEDKFNACYILLQAPGISPYIRGGAGRDPKNILENSLFADNFWVPIEPKDQNTKTTSDTTVQNTEDEEGVLEDKAIVKADIAPYLTQSEKDAALAEAKVFYSISPARLMYDATIAWMKINPNDSRISAALYRIVKIPRWTNHYIDGSSEYSQKAYRLLKTKYPNSSWAKQTKYWY